MLYILKKDWLWAPFFSNISSRVVFSRLAFHVSFVKTQKIIDLKLWTIPLTNDPLSLLPPHSTFLFYVIYSKLVNKPFKYTTFGMCIKSINTIDLQIITSVISLMSILEIYQHKSPLKNFTLIQLRYLEFEFISFGLFMIYNILKIGNIKHVRGIYLQKGCFYPKCIQYMYIKLQQPESIILFRFKKLITVLS